MTKLKQYSSLIAFLFVTSVMVIGINPGKGWAEENAFGFQNENTNFNVESASAPLQCAADTFYVDVVDGVDINDGLAPETAWRTIAKVNEAPLGPGDCVFFKRGQVWREELSIYFLDGTVDQPIVFSAYGEGPKPVINGADVVTHWSQHSENIWQATLTNGAIQGVWFDEQRGQRVESVGAISQDGQWFTDETTVYVYSSGNRASRYTNPGVEVAQRMTCINDSSEPSSFIVIDNFRLTHNGAVNSFAGAIDVRERGDGYWTIQNVEIEESAVMALMLRRSHLTVTNSKIINNDRGVLIHDDALNNSVEDFEVACSIDGGGISLYGHGHTIAYNKIHHNKWNGIFAWHAPPAAVEPIEENNTSNHTIIYNEVFNNGLGAGQEADGTQLDGLWLGNMDDSVVAYNLIYDNFHGQGIHLDDGCERNLVANNTIYGHLDNGSVRYSVGIHLEHGFNGRNNGELEYVSNNTVVNNNVFNNYMAIAMTAMKGERAPEEYETNYLNHNNYLIGPDGHHLGRYLETSIYSFEDWKSMTGQDADSISMDPQIASYPPRKVEDFRLTTESPCVDFGIEVGFSHDFEGNPVPQGSSPDLGAFEYGSREPICAGDLDGDGDFDGEDVDLIVAAILDGNLQYLCADTNDDGKVNVIDLQLLVIKSLE